MLDREKYFNKLKSLNQYKNCSEEDLYKIVDNKLQEEDLLTAFVGLGDDEKPKALKLYIQYVSECSFESLAEKSTLINLVRDEIIKERILTQIQEDYNNKSHANSLQLIEEVRDIEEHILIQKEKLGMLKNKDNNSFQIAWEELKKKSLDYFATHAGETYVKCPECQKLFRLLMKIEGLDVSKASFFKGTSLYNTKLLKLYEDKRLTIEEVAEILGVHSKYVDFIFQYIYLKEKEKEL